MWNEMKFWGGRTTPTLNFVIHLEKLSAESQIDSVIYNKRRFGMRYKLVEIFDALQLLTSEQRSESPRSYGE